MKLITPKQEIIKCDVVLPKPFSVDLSNRRKWKSFYNHETHDSTWPESKNQEKSKRQETSLFAVQLIRRELNLFAQNLLHICPGAKITSDLPYLKAPSKEKTVAYDSPKNWSMAIGQTVPASRHWILCITLLYGHVEYQRIRKSDISISKILKILYSWADCEY